MSSEKININTADVAALTTISGIGPALAERIIQYRQTVHPFEEVIELAAVPGISEKMVRGFEDRVRVQPIPQAIDEPEDIPLLDAPEEVILLGAPDQPEALLAAGLPDDSPEDDDDEVVVAETTPVAPVETAEVDEPEAETVSAAAEDKRAEVMVETADSPEIEDLPLAEPLNATMSDPNLFTAAPAQPSAEWEARARRRGCLNALVGATFGAILGAVLTLAILAAINGGSINYAFSDAQLREQLDTEIISRTNELNQLSTRVSLAATQEAAANQSLQTDFVATNEALNEELANNEIMISDLEQRLEDVAGAADTFTDFLDGLRLLLDDLEEGTATPTPAPVEATASPTPTPAVTSADTATPSATTAVSPTGAPTRTPLPTATPFSFPTNTPAPQP